MRGEEMKSQVLEVLALALENRVPEVLVLEIPLREILVLGMLALESGLKGMTEKVVLEIMVIESGLRGMIKIENHQSHTNRNLKLIGSFY